MGRCVKREAPFHELIHPGSQQPFCHLQHVTSKATLVVTIYQQEAEKNTNPQPGMFPYESQDLTCVSLSHNLGSTPSLQ